MENQPITPVEPVSSQPGQDTKRPGCITALCIYNFIMMGLSIFGLVPILSNPDYSRYLPSWYLPVLIISIPLWVVTIIGLWRMKKYGVILYTISSIINLLTTLSGMGSGNTALSLVSLAIAIWILVYLWKNYPKMS